MWDQFVVTTTWRATRLAIASVSSSNFRCFALVALALSESCVASACSLTISRAQSSARNAVISNGLGDWVEAALESTHPADSNVVHGCTVSVFVIDCGVLAQDMTVADSVDLVAGVAVLV